MEKTFQTEALPPMLAAICRDIDNFPQRYCDAYIGTHIRAQMKRAPVIFAGIKREIVEHGVKHYDGIITVDEQRLPFTFRCGLFRDPPSIECFFTDEERKSGKGSIFAGVTDDPWTWIKPSGDISCVKFGDYLNEQLETAVTFATFWALPPTERVVYYDPFRSLRGPSL